MPPASSSAIVVRSVSSDETQRTSRPRISPFQTDARIRGIAARQLGLITVAQAQAYGVDRKALARRRDAGALVPLFREVMRLAPFASTPQQRVLAAALAVPGSVVAGISAAVVHQFPLPPAIRRDVVLSVDAARVVRIPGITVVRHGIPLPSTPWLTARVATPLATIVLLPRYVDDELVERCFDHALAHRLLTVEGVRALIDVTPARAVHKRRLLLALLADRCDGMGHRSRLEQRVGRWLRNAGLTGWTRNMAVPVGAGRWVEVDFGWRSVRTALEVSPFFTHGSRKAQDRDAERRGLLGGVSWRVVEALDRHLSDERAFASRIAALRALGAT